MADDGIVIIGAGVAGLAAARALRGAGLRPLVLDKGRGPGGRLATRRTREGPVFDHGAQYVTAKGEGFAEVLAEAVAAGRAARWAEAGGEGRHVGLPGMDGLAAWLGEGADLRLGIEVTAVRPAARGWRIVTGDGEIEADRVALTAPAPQAARLLGDHPLAARLDGVGMAPCLTLMAAFEPGSEAPFVTRRDEAGPLGWIARDGAKPGRAGGETWVAQAGEAWSRAHLEADKEEIARHMLPLLCAAIGREEREATLVRGHRWRYARVTAPLGVRCVADESGTLVLGGDWCLGPRVEAAWESGRAVARALLGDAAL